MQPTFSRSLTLRCVQWPPSCDELARVQWELGRAESAPWQPPPQSLHVGACFVCFERGHSGPGSAGQPGWAGAIVMRDRKLLGESVIRGSAGAGYAPGLLAPREGPLLEAAVRALDQPPELLIVNASGRDHPRRAGLALHLGAVLDVPTVGVTHRPLHAYGDWPTDEKGAAAPLVLDDGRVGYWLRTRAGARPVAVHAAWRTSPELAADLVTRVTRRARTPEPLRRARRLARLARAGLTPAIPLPPSQPPGVPRGG